MLKLYGTWKVASAASTEPYLITVTENVNMPRPLKQSRAVLADSLTATDGFKAVLLRADDEAMPPSLANGSDVFLVPTEYAYLKEGDIIRVDPVSGRMRCLYRHGSPHNTILLTEQCNHYCLMCSQPPKNHDDSWLLQEARDVISLMPADAQAIGFSGGEPTLYGEGLVDLLRHTKRSLPSAAVDLLSNGRAFSSLDFAKSYASVDHPDLLVGIPVYSDDPVRHDYVVQSKGAFDETVRGILNLKKLHQKVEIRIVIHRQTVDRLVKTCEFIARNLLFVDHVALMGLEITGFTRANLDTLWIDPYEYRDVLSEAVAVLNAYKMNASVYNHPLCTVNSDVLKNYRKSISDWKNEYIDECLSCSKIHDCGGFFSSGKQYKHSQHIVPFN